MGAGRRKFTKEFKEEAVWRLGLGVSLAEVARACQVNPNVLHRWRRELPDFGAKAFVGNGLRRADEKRRRQTNSQSVHRGAHGKRVLAIFFRTEGSGEPLREWLKSLPSPEDRKLIGEDIKTVEFGWPVHTSRSQLDRLLDPTNVSVSLDTITVAAKALGKRLTIRISDVKVG